MGLFGKKKIDYYENGQKKIEEHLRLGKRHGLYLEWYENGQKGEETNYKKGKFEFG
jgi:antitoxin component YwqK of YwqJK toxin-antitoxin module